MEDKETRAIVARIEAVMSLRIGEECRVITETWGAPWWAALKVGADRISESRDRASKLEAVHDLALILGVDL